MAITNCSALVNLKFLYRKWSLSIASKSYHIVEALTRLTHTKDSELHRHHLTEVNVMLGVFYLEILIPRDTTILLAFLLSSLQDLRRRCWIGDLRGRECCSIFDNLSLSELWSPGCFYWSCSLLVSSSSLSFLGITGNMRTLWPHAPCIYTTTRKWLREIWTVWPSWLYCILVTAGFSGTPAANSLGKGYLCISLIF